MTYVKRPVWNPEDGMVFESIAETARHYKISASSVSAQLRGVYNTAGGMVFEYVSHKEALELGLSRVVLPKTSIPVVCIEDGRRFDSISQAAKFYGLNQSTLSSQIKNNTVSRKGINFKRLDQKESL